MSEQTIETQRCFVVEGPHVVILGPQTLYLPRASQKLEHEPDQSKKAMFELLTELGSEAHDVVSTSTTLRLVRSEIGELNQVVRATLTETMTKERTLTTQQLRGILQDYGQTLITAVARYLDPESQHSVATALGKQLEVVGQRLLKDNADLLVDGDEGIMTKTRDAILKELDASTTKVLTEFAARRALATRSNLSGRPYEEAVHAKVVELARPSDDSVARCGDTRVPGRGGAGDTLVTVNPIVTRGADIKVVIEAKRRGDKAQRWTRQAVADALRTARMTRRAVAAIFVADTRDILPDGLGFGQIAPGDYYVLFDPEEGDDVGLAAAMYLARAAAIATLPADGADIDVPASLKAADRIRVAMSRLAAVDAEQQKAIASIKKAGTGCDDIRAEVLGALRQLDEALQP